MIRVQVGALCGAVLCLLSAVCVAAIGERTVHVGSEDSHLSLSRHVDWLEEPAGGMCLEEAESSTNFHENSAPLLNPGLSGSVIWARVKLRNDAGRARELAISLNRFSLPICEIYFLHDGVTRTLFDGAHDSYRDTFRHFGTLAASFKLPAGDEATVFVRYKGSNWSALDLTLHDSDDLRTQQQRNIALFLVVSGVVLALVAYGAMTTMFLGWRIVGLYILAQISFFVFFAHLSGITTVYLWPDNPATGTAVSPVAFTIYLVSMAQFGRLFFMLKGRLPRLDRVLQLSVWVGLCALALIPVSAVSDTISRQLPLLLIYPDALISWLLLPALAGYATLRWESSYWPLFAGWSITGFYTVAMILLFTGVIPTLPLGKQSYVVFVVIETMFLALAMGLRIRTMRSSLTRAEQDLRVALQSQLRAAEQRGWALQDLAEKGRLLLATGHDSKQMLLALRSLAAKLRSGAISEVAQQMDGIADNLESVFSTAINASYSGGIEDDVLCLDTVRFSDLVQPLQMIHEKQAQQRNIELRFAGADVVFATDKVLLLRILSNLIANAIRHADATKILVALRTRRGRVVLQVRDNGRGLSAERGAALLANGTEPARPESETYGSGIGLNIVKSLVRRLDGTLQLRSAPELGTCFQVSIEPAAVQSHAATVWLDDVDVASRRVIELVCATLDWPLRTLASGPAVRARTGLHFVSAPRLLEHSGAEPVFTVALTYDRSASHREALSQRADLVLYQPLDAVQVRAALARYSRAAA